MFKYLSAIETADPWLYVHNNMFCTTESPFINEIWLCTILYFLICVYHLNWCTHYVCNSTTTIWIPWTEWKLMKKRILRDRWLYILNENRYSNTISAVYNEFKIRGVRSTEPNIYCCMERKPEMWNSHNFGIHV